MNKKVYKISFYDEEHKPLVLYASELIPSSLLGFVEAAGLVFIDPSEIIKTVNDDVVRKLFKDVDKTYIPLAQIIRIDEVMIDKKTPIIKIYKPEK